MAVDSKHTGIMEVEPAGAPAPPGTEAVTTRRARFKHQARAEFDKWALSYDRSLLNELIFYPSLRTCQQEIARWQARRSTRPFRMLDIGCGTGSLLALISHNPQAELLVGLDFARVMVRQATDKFARSEQAGKLHAVQGDSERLPFPSQTFDVVTCCNSFHHYPHQAQAVREFRRVLRPGGLLVLIDGFRDNVIGWVVFDVGVASVEKHVHHASWSELHRMLVHDADFAALHQRKVNVFAPLLVNVARVAE
jgi:ubiquinone/menaquinone biosynthesis C-methylase UbiE